MFGFGKKDQKAVADNFEVPSFPGTVLSLLAKLRNPEVATNELADDLEMDPGLHVRVLKTVNSVAFGLSHKVGNIHHAVNLLGRGRLESLVLTVAVKESLSANNKAAWFDMKQFWATAARRAVVARGLAAELHPHLQSEAFTFGLLQDMAVPVLANREGERYRKIYQGWLQQDEFDLVAEERRHLSTDHPSIGAQMAKSWGFPESLVDGIGQHHQPHCENIPLSVRIASLIKGPANSDDGKVIAAKAEQLFGLDPSITLALIENVLQESQELADALK